MAERRRLQILLDDDEAGMLAELTSKTGATESDAIRAALRLASEQASEPGGEALVKPLTSPDWPWPPWWGGLVEELERRQRDGVPVETETGVRNHIVSVARDEGYVVLHSERSRGGGARTITIGMLKNPERATAHGVIVRVLRTLADREFLRKGAASAGWVGSFRVFDLLARCLDDDQPWPPDALGVYLVTRRPWKGGPDQNSRPLYTGSTTGRSARFCTRVGDLIADLFGFYGDFTGHSSGGQKLNKWCYEERIHPGDLHIGWYSAPGMCARCDEVRIYDELQPTWNSIRPPACGIH